MYTFARGGWLRLLPSGGVSILIVFVRFAVLVWHSRRKPLQRLDPTSYSVVKGVSIWTSSMHHLSAACQTLHGQIPQLQVGRPRQLTLAVIH